MTKPETNPSARENGRSGDQRSPGRARKVRTEALLLTLAAAGAAPVLGFACTSNAPPNDFDTSASSNDTSSSSSGGVDGGDLFDGGFQNPVTVTPDSPVLKLEVPLAAQTIQFACNDTGLQQPVDADWSLSSLELGTISPTGLFQPNGKRNGEVTVICKQKNTESVGQTKLRVIIHAVDNQGGVTQQQMDTLRGPPGLSDVSWQFLYPYDETIFPRGILAPEIHLAQGSSPGNTFYVNVVAQDMEYEGFFNASPNNTQLQMSQDAWVALSNSASGTKIEVRISKISNGKKYGPIFRRWTIANGKLHGTIYYNTYDSPLAGSTGAMMRIKGNSPTAEVLVGNCTVCHSVGADGSTAAAANHNGAGGTFDLTGGNVNPPIVWSESEMAAFAGVYPKNGEVIVIHGAPGSGNTPGTGGQYKSELRTKNGTVIPNSGIEPFYAQTPAFSLDGTRLAFTDRTAVQTSSSTLSILNYDPAAQKFSGYDVLGTPPPGHHLSWPAFTPDGKYVVYQNGTGDDLVTWGANTGRIFAVDPQTKQVTYLAKLNGDGYMPQGSRDENKNYEPTMAPIASGGYFWIMFTSRRTYGNKLTGSEYETKRLWVAAIDINAPPGKDSSHPAFYISGQELTSGNSRGFWALDPCKQDGLGCEGGDECCNGYCNPTGDPPVFLCGPPDGNCSDENEKCATAADCCNPTLECVGGVCSQVTN